MKFLDAISQYKASQIIESLGCPKQTAYAWLSGKRKPPSWQQILFLSKIEETNRKRGGMAKIFDDECDD